ncbi:MULTISPECIES: hypothetical protein [unclassified Nostoc]|uniref:hypothetical protein n=1 Tax=unclassified Nostoc TaxID=2593658 RepID=UPI0025D00049|nr:MULTISPECIES: hypothetical protein [unclassified Nostoc]
MTDLPLSRKGDRIKVILIINIDPFRYPDHIVMSAIAAVIFGAILWLGQTEMKPRVFALINTVVGISVFSVLVWFNDAPSAEYVPAQWHDKIMHVCLDLGDRLLMGSDIFKIL